MSNILSFEEFYQSVWLKVPSVWRDADDDNGKGLQVLTYTMAQHMYYYFYNKIVYLDQLFDPDLCPATYLKFLSSLIGWDLIGSDEASWREQIKAAPLLYKIKGTKRGIVLAERLVGYSVFIADLYRDHVGDIVPKELIWNNTPDEIVDKPWCRTITRDDSGNVIPGDIESDLFDSYNAGSAFLNDAGVVVRPAIDVINNTLVARTLSTTPTYNNLTGAGSLARYAKTPRINVVLKKLTPLDATDSASNVLGSNIDEAVNLLFEFKPFHVYVNNLEVLVDLSDFTLGATNQVSAGDGSNADDTINYREDSDFSVYINTENDVAETISYGATTTGTPTYWTPTTTAPTVSVSVSKVSLSALPAITDFQTANTLGFSPKNYVDAGPQVQFGYGFINGLFIDRSDFDMANSIITNGQTDYVDIATRTIRLSSIHPTPTFKLRQVDLSNILNQQIVFDLQSSFVAKHSLFYQPLPYIQSSSISEYSQQDSVSIAYGSLIEVQNSLNGMPWNLKNLNGLHTTTPAPVGAPGWGATEYLNILFTNTYLFILNYGSASIILDNTHYIMSGQVLTLDTVQIALSLSSVATITDDTFLDAATLDIVYLTRSKEVDDFPLTTTSRSMYINSRNTSIFSRQYDAQNLLPTVSDEIKSVSQYTFNSSIGSLDIDYATTRTYITNQTVYTRGSLSQQLVSNNTPVVVKNTFNVCDTNQWQVYSQLFTSYYAGSQQVSNVWWTDFYQVDPGVQTDGYLIPYTSVDTSYDSHEANRNSDRWQTALLSLDFNNPNDFLATRQSSLHRNAIWTRGSASRLSLPFVGDNRAGYQLNRGNDVLFNRLDNLSDYATNIANPSTLANYKYVSTATYNDCTINYFNSEFITESPVLPQTEDLTPSPLQIHPTNETYIIGTPVNTTIYDSSMSFTDRSAYYTTGSLYTSPYACNMVVRNYPQLPGLFSDSLDTLDIQITGDVSPVVNTCPPFSQLTKVIKFSVTRSVITSLTTTGQLLKILIPTTDLMVSWYTQSGSYLSSSLTTSTLMPLVSDEIASPDILVFVNGIEVNYMTSWRFICGLDNSVYIELLPIISYKLSLDDIVEVQYQTKS